MEDAMEENPTTSEDSSAEDIGIGSWSWLGWLWCRSSEEALRDAESAVLSCLSGQYSKRYVNIGQPLVDRQEDIKVWTISCNESLNGPPLVFMHGLGSGSALWVLNLDGLRERSDFPIYAIDVPGFGRSSRPQYSNDAEQAEEELAQVVDAWRDRMGFESMILCGHSFGGFIAFAYALRHPDRVLHLIGADPWGFNREPTALADIKHIPPHHRFIVHILKKLPLNPLWSVRAAGPAGPRLIRKIRTDLIGNFKNHLDNAAEKVANYVFHCNAQNPTGEAAFYAIMSMFGWAKRPMHQRLSHLHPEIGITLIYGAKSWVDHLPTNEVIRLRHDSYVDCHVVDAGHHVYADQPSLFNAIIEKACWAGTKNRLREL